MISADSARMNCVSEHSDLPPSTLNNTFQRLTVKTILLNDFIDKRLRPIIASIWRNCCLSQWTAVTPVPMELPIGVMPAGQLVCSERDLANCIGLSDIALLLWRHWGHGPRPVEHDGELLFSLLDVINWPGDGLLLGGRSIPYRRC